MIKDTRTGKILVTSKQLLKDVKKWLSTVTKDDFRKWLEEAVAKDKEKNNAK